MFTSARDQKETRAKIGMGEETLLGFGKFNDWGYGATMAEKPHYATYICPGSEDVREEQKEFTDWVNPKGRSIEKEALATGAH